jgi:hypothetical protein
MKEKNEQRPEYENERGDDEADRGPAHRHQTDHCGWKTGRHRRVDLAGRASPRQCFSAQEIADRGRDNFDSGRDPVERRGEGVAEPRGREPNEDKLPAQRREIDVSSQEAHRAQLRKAAGRTVVSNGQVIAQVQYGRPAGDLDGVRADDRVGSGRGGRSSKHKRWNNGVGRFEQHRYVAWHSARIR